MLTRIEWHTLLGDSEFIKDGCASFVVGILNEDVGKRNVLVPIF